MRRLLQLALLCPLAAWAATGPDTPAALNAALHDVLVHNDLSDVDALSRTLGLGLRLLKPAPHDPHVRDSIQAIPTANPTSILASGLSYYADIPNKTGNSSITLSFQPRSCPDLRQLASDWHQPVTEGMLTDAAGMSESTQWNGQGGIGLNIIYTSGGCTVSLSQPSPKALPVTAAQIPRRMSTKTLLRQVVDLLAVGDLRAITRTARIFHTEFVTAPDEMRRGRFYKGYAMLAYVIPGVDPGLFYYSADDTGWVSPPAFFVTPRHLSERMASLRFKVDTEAACFSASDIERELARRSINYVTEAPPALDTGYADSIYSVTGENRLILTATSVGRCVDYVDFSQVTDIQHSVSTPIIFPVLTSYDAQSGTLSDAAIGKLDWLMARLKGVSLKSIEIQAFHSADSTDEEKRGGLQLAQLVKQSLLDKGVRPQHLQVAAAQPRPPAFEEGGKIYVSVDTIRY
jgi:hypothetical protein